MTVGFRLRRTNGAVILDNTHLTMAASYRNIMVISGSGSLNVPGVSAATHIPMILPYNPPPPQKWYPDGSFDPQPQLPCAPRMRIEGSTIIWTCDSVWQPAWYIVLAMRVR